MRIGVLTLPLFCNYGGILQAYALQKVLSDAGHDVVLIDFPKEWNVCILKKFLLYIKRFILKYIFRHPIIVKIDKKYNSEINLITKNTSVFINKHIKRIVITNFSKLDNSQFDVLIVGSDQVWRPKYFNKKIENAYFSFAKKWKIKRISYAVSFGSDEWEYNHKQTITCSRLIQLFNAVSVREKSGEILCRKYFNIDAIHVLDPTMLLNKIDYIQLFSDSVVKNSGNLFCYILDHTIEKDNVISLLSKEFNMRPFEVNSKYNDSSVKISERIQPPVELWLKGFNDADLIFTDSFHACVFSIIFNKPFIVIKNKERGIARIDSLLEMFGLQNRILSSLDDLTIIMKSEIDWTNINLKLQYYKKISLSFLNSNINA